MAATREGDIDALVAVLADGRAVTVDIFNDRELVPRLVRAAG
jgi:hypothetical protein